MPIVNFSYPKIIGISGAARAGKDTLCRSLIRFFEKKNIKAVRKSIAGDTVKRDLKDLVWNKLGIDTFTENNEEKECIRPLLVEYGKLMRSKTHGRYFIDQFEPEKDAINIIPDIRYSEYPTDEVHWVQKEMNGFLIFLERDGVLDVNDTERVNNKIIKEVADYKFKWKSLDENIQEDLEKLNQYARNIDQFLYIREVCNPTTSQEDI